MVEPEGNDLCQIPMIGYVLFPMNYLQSNGVNVPLSLMVYTHAQMVQPFKSHGFKLKNLRYQNFPIIYLNMPKYNCISTY